MWEEGEGWPGAERGRERGTGLHQTTSANGVEGDGPRQKKGSASGF